MIAWTSSRLSPRYKWPFSTESISDSRSLLPKRCSFLLKRRQGGRFGSSAHLWLERPACTFKATALWASACSGGQQCKVQKSEEAKCKVKKPTCSLMQLRPRLVLCAEIACCWLAHLPPAQEFIHRAGRLTREDCLQANKSYCTLHYRPEFPLGPISALSKPPTPFTLQADVHCHRRLPLGFIHRGLSAGRLKVEACAIH